MLLNAELLTTLQRCERRVRLESTHKVLRVRPKELFDHLLSEGMFKLSNGAGAAEVAEDCCTAFLEAAADPGLAILSDPYTLAMDYAAIFRTVFEAASREVLLALKPGGVITIGEHAWGVQAYRDDSGLLHRWTSVERWDADAQYRALHSWFCFGDCAAAGQGMWLHVVEIGRHSKGHQLSPWCRCFKHPAIAKHYRFRHTDGSPLEGNWRAVYYQDSDQNEPKVWVDLMERDGVKPLQHLQVRDPHPEHVQQFRKDLPVLCRELSDLPAAWTDIPMRRTSCDIPPCPWQLACYGTPGVPLEAIGGFVKIEVPRADKRTS